MNEYEAVIGLELHIQLATESKLFSSSGTIFGQEPNTQINEIDLGYPGVLPVLNKRAVEYAALFGMAIGSRINPRAVFMRKNYFYPDLPKGYQISQLAEAVIDGGEIYLEEFDRRVRINRGQLEEDAGKSVHDAFSDRTGIDLNRAGVPLIELVSEPDMRSAKEAVAFMRKIHHLVRYLGISDGNMQEGSFRCDANVSIRPTGSTEFNNRVELKNINSFRFVEQAINLEIERQIEVVENGGTVEQETRLFDPDRQETRTMRTKEEANDYRYFPDPDLLPLDLSQEFLSGIENLLPELPQNRRARYADYGFDADLLNFLVQDLATGDYFDAVLGKTNDAKLSANWLHSELYKLLDENTKTFSDNPIAADKVADLLAEIKANTISGNAGKKVLQELFTAPDADVAQLIDKLGLRQLNDDAQIRDWVAEIVAANPQQVAAYRAGQGKMLGFFVGQVLKKSGGKANPKIVNEMLREVLDA
ncbi:MAG: Asp-tRNA(Asn)/Glu-tRNA(Gln) amidotransferase subunit GatB [Cardiobacteriaceae bacterium]|nr:Asp-tRNA(Asn)/Glu-tRNA(Gln) amidotransferase subunit GatB [Cardiobacteriaceae bacterium]